MPCPFGTWYVSPVRCVAAEIERVSRIEAGELDEDAATHDPVPAITKVGPYIANNMFFVYSFGVRICDLGHLYVRNFQ